LVTIGTLSGTASERAIAIAKQQCEIRVDETAGVELPRLPPVELAIMIEVPGNNRPRGW